MKGNFKKNDCCRHAITQICKAAKSTKHKKKTKENFFYATYSKITLAVIREMP